MSIGISNLDNPNGREFGARGDIYYARNGVAYIKAYGEPSNLGWVNVEDFSDDAVFSGNWEFGLVGEVQPDSAGDVYLKKAKDTLNVGWKKIKYVPPIPPQPSPTPAPSQLPASLIFEGIEATVSTKYGTQASNGAFVGFGTTGSGSANIKIEVLEADAKNLYPFVCGGLGFPVEYQFYAPTESAYYLYTIESASYDSSGTLYVGFNAPTTASLRITIDRINGGFFSAASLRSDETGIADSILTLKGVHSPGINDPSPIGIYYCYSNLTTHSLSEVTQYEVATSGSMSFAGSNIVQSPGDYIGMVSVYGVSFSPPSLTMVPYDANITWLSGLTTESVLFDVNVPELTKYKILNNANPFPALINVTVSGSSLCKYYTNTGDYEFENGETSTHIVEANSQYMFRPQYAGEQTDTVSTTLTVTPFYGVDYECKCVSTILNGTLFDIYAKSSPAVGVAYNVTFTDGTVKTVTGWSSNDAPYGTLIGTVNGNPTASIEAICDSNDNVTTATAVTESDYVAYTNTATLCSEMDFEFGGSSTVPAFTLAAPLATPYYVYSGTTTALGPPYTSNKMYEIPRNIQKDVITACFVVGNISSDFSLEIVCPTTIYGNQLWHALDVTTSVGATISDSTISRSAQGLSVTIPRSALANGATVTASFSAKEGSFPYESFDPYYHNIHHPISIISAATLSVYKKTGTGEIYNLLATVPMHNCGVAGQQVVALTSTAHNGGSIRYAAFHDLTHGLLADSLNTGVQSHGGDDQLPIAMTNLSICGQEANKVENFAPDDAFVMRSDLISWSDPIASRYQICVTRSQVALPVIPTYKVYGHDRSKFVGYPSYPVGGNYYRYNSTYSGNWLLATLPARARNTYPMAERYVYVYGGSTPPAYEKFKSLAGHCEEVGYAAGVGEHAGRFVALVTGLSSDTSILLDVDY